MTTINLPLFGEHDVYVNTLESEITLVRDEIKKAVKAGERAEKKYDELIERLNKLTVVRDALMDKEEPEGDVEESSEDQGAL